MTDQLRPYKRFVGFSLLFLIIVSAIFWATNRNDEKESNKTDRYSLGISIENISKNLGLDPFKIEDIKSLNDNNGKEWPRQMLSDDLVIIETIGPPDNARKATVMVFAGKDAPGSSFIAASRLLLFSRIFSPDDDLSDWITQGVEAGQKKPGTKDNLIVGDYAYSLMHSPLTRMTILSVRHRLAPETFAK